MYEVAVLIPSCDHYSDLWKPFFNLFWRYWDDCSYAVYLGSNHKRCYDDRIHTIMVGDDISWSDGVLAMLESIQADYIIFMLEDFFLRSKVDSGLVNGYIKVMDKLGGAMLRLVPNPGPDIRAEGLPVGIISKEAPYRVSTQGAIWNMRVLKSLLLKGESAWEFELNGTQRSKLLGQGFYGTTRPVLTYQNHVVERGKWFPKEASRFKKQGIGCDFSQRDIMNPLQYYVWNLNHILSLVCRPIPSRVKSKAKTIAFRSISWLSRHGK